MTIIFLTIHRPLYAPRVTAYLDSYLHDSHRRDHGIRKGAAARRSRTALAVGPGKPAVFHVPKILSAPHRSATDWNPVCSDDPSFPKIGERGPREWCCVWSLRRSYQRFMLWPNQNRDPIDVGL